MNFTLSAENIETISQRVKELITEETTTIVPQDKNEKTYTAEQIAVITNTTPATITRYLRIGLIEGKKAGKNWLVNQEALNKYIGK
jgi:Fic family protein